MGPRQPGNSPGPGSEVVKSVKFAKEQERKKNGRKEMQRPGKIEDIKKIHVRAKEVLQYGIGDFVW